MFRKWSLAGRIFAANLVLILLVAGAAMIWQAFDLRHSAYETAALRTQAVAGTIAANPLVVQAARTADPSRTLQGMAEQIMADTGVDFVTIMSKQKVRWTHANPEEIGGQYLGTVEQALRGETLTETYTGTLGPSVRTIVPVRDGGGGGDGSGDHRGAIVALVSVGLSVSSVESTIAGRLGSIAALAAALAGGGALLAFALGRYLRRMTHGLGPEQMAQFFAYYESVLHSVREGVLLVDPEAKVVLVNDQALALLGTERPPPGGFLDVKTLPVEQALRDVLLGAQMVRDEAFLAQDRVLLVTQEAALLPDSRVRGSGENHAGLRFAGARRRPRALGTVVTLRDRTEVASLGAELATMKTFSDALRAQGHEHANRIHLLVSLMELGRIDQALELATKDLRLGQRLADQLFASTEEPVLAALLMGKAAEAHERGVALEVDVSAVAAPLEYPAEELVTVIGNLLDNAIDAAATDQADAQVRLEVRMDAAATTILVSDSGPGLSVLGGAEGSIFDSGVTTKSSELGRGVGLALVRQSVTRMGGSIRAYASGTLWQQDAPAAQRSSTVEPLPGAHFVVALARGNPGSLADYE